MLKPLDSILKWLGIAWSLAAFVGAIAFFSGGIPIIKYRAWQGKIQLLQANGF
jgi:hypothetical protein